MPYNDDSSLIPANYDDYGWLGAGPITLIDNLITPGIKNSSVYKFKVVVVSKPTS